MTPHQPHPPTHTHTHTHDTIEQRHMYTCMFHGQQLYLYHTYFQPRCTHVYILNRYSIQLSFHKFCVIIVSIYVTLCMDWVIITQLNKAGCLVVHVCLLVVCSPSVLHSFLPALFTSHVAGAVRRGVCTVRVRLTERDLDSLQEAYIGGGIKGTDKDKTISLSLSNAQTHCPTCTHFSHCSSTSVCVCVWGGGGRWEGGTTCWVTHVHARRQREGPTYVAIAI